MMYELVLVRYASCNLPAVVHLAQKCFVSTVVQLSKAVLTRVLLQIAWQSV